MGAGRVPRVARLHERARGQARPDADDRPARLSVRVAFVVNDLQLSGGVGVVVEHARQLTARHGFEVDLVLAREQDGARLGLPRARRRARARDGARAAPATTTSSSRPGGRRSGPALELPARRHAYFVQSLEDRFYRPGRAAAARRRAHPRPPAARHHRGALDRRDARGADARSGAACSSATASTRTSSRSPRGAAGARRRAAADPRRGQPGRLVQGRARGARGDARR